MLRLRHIQHDPKKLLKRVSKVIFSSLDIKAKEFYRDEGYIQLRTSEREFSESVKNLKLYYDTADPGEGSKAFRSADGSPRQFVNIFRDSNSDAYNLFKTPISTNLINTFTEGPAIFTNAKLSFKIPNNRETYRGEYQSTYSQLINFHLFDGLKHIFHF